MLCRSCGGRCRDAPTPECPAEIECGECQGEGCPHCDQGHWRLESCPREYLDSETWQAVMFAGDADRGHLPLPGGLLDQSAWFVELQRQLRSEVARVDAERMEAMRGGR